jgi:DNA-binding MarR family transcriptional regulator
MTHRQTPSAESISPAQHHALRETIRSFLNDRFAGQSGWLCLGWIDGDPQIEPLREEWYHMPRQAQIVTGRALELADRGYNLFVGLCLFSSRKRSYATALPSAWLWIDDAAIEGAELVESSAGNYQSWLKLDQPLSAQERSTLQRALRDTMAGADNCSADAVHMARLPGGWNRKQHGTWQVSVARPADTIVNVADLRTRYPIVLRERTSIEEDDWCDLPSGSRLSQSRRFMALVKANEQLRKVCAGERVALRMRNGRDDDSLSNQRAIFVCQLIHAHYPHDEIRALAHHFMGRLASQPERFELDIDKLLQRYTPADYTPEPTRATSSTRQPAPPRGGRHYTLTAGELLDFYHQYADCGPRGIVLEWTRGEVAQHLGVSYDTVQRREAELIAAGQIRRQFSADRQRSLVILSPQTWDLYAQGSCLPHAAAAHRPTAPDAARETAVPDGEKQPDDGSCAPRALAEITHQPADTASASPLCAVPTVGRPELASTRAALVVVGVCLPVPSQPADIPALWQRTRCGLWHAARNGACVGLTNYTAAKVIATRPMQQCRPSGLTAPNVPISARLHPEVKNNTMIAIRALAGCWYDPAMLCSVGAVHDLSLCRIPCQMCLCACQHDADGDDPAKLLYRARLIAVDTLVRCTSQTLSSELCKKIADLWNRGTVNDFEPPVRPETAPPA